MIRYYDLEMILVRVIKAPDSYNLTTMLKYVIQVGMFLILFSTLYSIYKSKTGKYKRHKQITAALIGAFLLMYMLYTCNSDN